MSARNYIIDDQGTVSVTTLMYLHRKPPAGYAPMLKSSKDV